jgi:hypothetical protein
VPVAARAQSSTQSTQSAAPDEDPAAVATDPVLPPPPPPGSNPATATASGAVTPAPSTGAPLEVYGTTPDPAFTHHFQMPSARPLHHGDSMLTVLGSLGWLGIRHGFTRRFDAGIGLPYYLAGLSADARFALALGDTAAVSLWGYVTVPLHPGDGSPASWLGFTWQGGGPAWVFGPLASVWGSRAGVHLGVHLAQRTLLGGLWLMSHATVEARILDSVRAIVQAVVLAEIVNETGSPGGSTALLGNAHPRILPYGLAGVRIHSRRFAVDFGLLVVIGSDTPLSTGTAGLWPWLSMGYTF